MDRVTDPADTDIAWCIQLYKSNPEPCLEYLRTHYPDSRIVLISDGDNESLPGYKILATHFRALLIDGDHLMSFETCHLYVSRMLQQALKGEEQFYFRIDPDTRIWRRFRWLPGIACAFGTLETVTDAFKDRISHPPNIQGGCIGFTRHAIENVLRSGLLTYAHCVSNAQSGWARCEDGRYITAQNSMLDDFILSWAVDAVGHPLIQHPEIASYWRNPVSNLDLRFAVTHPHKEMESGS